MDIIQKGCAPTNFRTGRRGFQPKAIVIHIIVGSQKSCDLTFQDPKAQRSAHFSISKSGIVHQYVDPDDTAFHAGTIVAPTWQGMERDTAGNFINPNLYTIGIEHEGMPEDDWPDTLYAASSELVRDLAAHYRIPLDPQHIIHHREIRANKTCPGFKADLSKIIALARGSAPPPPTNTQTVVTTANANLRKGQPSTVAPILRTVPAGTSLQMKTLTTGQNVKGNVNWWKDLDGNFIWAGATNRPTG